MTCKDCIHYDVCINHEECKDFADSNKFIELPCKIGERAYLVSKSGKIVSGEIVSIRIRKNKEKIDFHIYVDFGKTVGQFYLSETPNIYFSEEKAIQATKKEKHKPLPGELELINQYTRRDFNEDDVFVFSIELCNNEIDRDYERFTVESLEKLSELFVGKNGFFDNSPREFNEVVKIFSCKVERVNGKKNLFGDDYFRLVARAYMPISDRNKHLRESIGSGITREVSVGCSVQKTLCSICGKEITSDKCPHIKGKIYDSRLCYGKLVNPTEVYDCAFVAARTKEREKE